MRKRIYSIIVVLTLIISLLSPVGVLSFAAEMEGDGTALSPFLIKTPTDLYNIKDNVSAHYKLANDLDFENVPRQPISTFSGVLDGDGYIIKNVKIDGADKVGLFGTLSKATVKNLGIVDAEVSASGNEVGVLFGSASEASLENNYVKNGIVSGKSNVGMLGGYFRNGKLLTKCHTIGGKINASGAYAGGFIGNLERSSISQCYSSSTVENTSSYTGGLAGYAYADVIISECFYIGKLVGNDYVGGLVGRFHNLIVANSFAAGTITSKERAAGLLCEDSSTLSITNCYAASHISGKTVYALANYSNTDNTKNSYVDSNITGLNEPGYQVRTTEQMYQKSNYADWDFDTIWTIEYGMDYPKLRFTDFRDEKFSRLKVIMGVGEELLMSVSNVLLDNSDMTWTSSDKSIVSVDSEGRVKAHKLGQATIYSVNDDEYYSSKINILVVQDPDIYRLAVDLKVADERRITIDTLENSGNVQWLSAEPTVAKISKKGKVKAVSKGLALIKALDKDGAELGHVYIRIR